MASHSHKDTYDKLHESFETLKKLRDPSLNKKLDGTFQKIPSKHIEECDL